MKTLVLMAGVLVALIPSQSMGMSCISAHLTPPWRHILRYNMIFEGKLIDVGSQKNEKEQRERYFIYEVLKNYQGVPWGQKTVTVYRSYISPEIGSEELIVVTQKPVNGKLRAIGGRNGNMCPPIPSMEVISEFIKSPTYKYRHVLMLYLATIISLLGFVTGRKIYRGFKARKA